MTNRRLDFQGAINVVAGTKTLDAQGAANVWAGDQDTRSGRCVEQEGRDHRSDTQRRLRPPGGNQDIHSPTLDAAPSGDILMKRTHWGQHGEDCFGCRVQTVSIAASAMPTRSPQAVQLENRERRWSRDMDAYSRLRRDHVQPRKIDGSADLEIRSSEKYEVEHGMVSPNPTARKRTSKILSELGQV